MSAFAGKCFVGRGVCHHIESTYRKTALHILDCTRNDRKEVTLYPCREDGINPKDKWVIDIGIVLDVPDYESAEKALSGMGYFVPAKEDFMKLLYEEMELHPINRGSISYAIDLLNGTPALKEKKFAPAITAEEPADLGREKRDLDALGITP